MGNIQSSTQLKLFGAVTILIALTILFFTAATPTTAQQACEPAWNSGAVYTGGDKVSHDGHNWRAKWWTTAEEPGTTGQWGVWADEGVCGSGGSTNTPIPPTATDADTTPIPTETAVPPTATPISGESCTGIPHYSAGTSFTAGQLVQNVGNKYTCNIPGWCSSNAAWAYEPGPGQHWQDAWSLSGSCGDTNPTVTAVPPTSTTVPPTVTTTTVPPTVTPDGPTPTPSATPDGGSSSCPVQDPPTGKVLVGYWETWDNSPVHPGMGHIPITDSHPNYNVINIAFPVLRADGSMVFEDEMAPGEDVPSPAEICAAKAQGRHILISIGGAAAGIDLNSRAVAQQFVDTAVPILKEYNFDGIDIDIESGLVAGASWSQNSTSQDNLIFIIDSILAQMPSNFMLTMAPETAYVTGGQIAYGGPWGAYMPIIKRYLDNGRLNWLQMQYYNGGMYGCPGGVATSYEAGTVAGFVEQTKCMNNGFQIVGGPVVQIPYSKQVPGLPAQEGAGGGYMSPSLVNEAYSQVSSVKGLMTWSINWDGSKNWTFATNNKPQ